MLQVQSGALKPAYDEYNHRILNRKLLKTVGEWVVPPSNSEVLKPEDIKEEVLKIYNDPEGVKDLKGCPIFPIKEEHVRCVVSKNHYGMQRQDPLEMVLFFSNKDKKQIGDWSDESAQPMELKVFIFWDQDPTNEPSMNETVAKAIKSRLSMAFMEFAEKGLQGGVREQRLEWSVNKNSSKTRQL